VRQVLSASVADPLQLIAERTQEVGQAELVTITMPGPAAGMLRVQVVAGSGQDVLAGYDFSSESIPRGKGFRRWRAVPGGEPGRVADLMPLPPGLPDIGSVMVVPLLGTRGVTGVLTVARQRGRLAFTAAELDGANGFANQAAHGPGSWPRPGLNSAGPRCSTSGADRC
jgi:GAF domain-containing protein